MTARAYLVPIALLLAACQAPQAARGVMVGPAAPGVVESAQPVATPVPPSGAPGTPTATPALPPALPRAGSGPRPLPIASTRAPMPAPATSTSPAPAESGAPLPGRAVPLAAGQLTTGAWMLRLATGAATAPVLADLALAGFRVRGELNLGGRVLLRVDPPAGLDAAAVQARLAGIPGVTQALPEPRRHRQDFDFTQPDPFFGFQWAHRPDRGNTLGAWELVPVADQRRIVVAVLDTGLDVGHPEFAGRVVTPRNFTNDGGEADVTDTDGHGTHVTGIAAATGGNDAGVAGVAWGVKVLPVKVLDDTGDGDEFDILAGFLHAVRWRPAPDNGDRVRVVNLSLGSATGSVSALWTEAIAEASAAGVVVCAASGNAGYESVDAPANTPGVLAVGSSNTYLFWEDVSPFSNHGARVDLVAPGEDIYSTSPRANTQMELEYAYESGTSMASPYVAGVAALIVARYDKDHLRTNAAFAEGVRQRLLRAVTDLGVPGRDPWFGEGRLDARRAVAPATLDAAP